MSLRGTDVWESTGSILEDEEMLEGSTTTGS